MKIGFLERCVQHGQEKRVFDLTPYPGNQSFGICVVKRGEAFVRRTDFYAAIIFDHRANVHLPQDWPEGEIMLLGISSDNASQTDQYKIHNGPDVDQIPNLLSKLGISNSALKLANKMP